MTPKHAILGSREWPRLGDVEARLDELHARQGSDWILISGGAAGVCWTAEQGHLARGGRVVSFRPVERGLEDFRVQEWRLPDGGLIEHPLTFGDWTSAAMYRSMLIAERSHHGDAYWDGHSRGTMFEIDAFAGANTPLRVVKPVSYAQPIGEWQPPTAIGIVVAKNFPDEELLRSKLREGIAKKGNTVTWVMREKPADSHAARWAWDEFAAHDIEPVYAPSLRYWGTHRGLWRDREMLNLCERIVVFHDIGSTVTNSFVTDQYHVARVFVIERGEKKKRQKKGRAVA